MELFSGTILIMSELLLKSVNALTVSNVETGSSAEKAGVIPGDVLTHINGKPVLDILDYRFHSAYSRLIIKVERDSAAFTLTIRKEQEEDAGLEFENDLGDHIHTCKNKCVFCFIHQQPKKMRRSLYLMDDDFRLSFMHGNYITLTNLSELEWRRILDQKLSPLYVSVHSTDPELRGKLLGKREPAPILPQLREMAQHRIDVHAQIVLCPNLNDGEALEKTISELAAEHPSITGRRSGVLSVAIVPVGMTQFRAKLPKLQGVEREYARDLITRINSYSKQFLKSLGTRFIWLGDEWRYLAEKPFPGKAHYEDFPQLEDGIGTVRLFLEDLRRISRRLPARAASSVSATLVTAELPAPQVKKMADRFNQIQGVDINVCVVKNLFFGGNINIAGLLTGQDIIERLKQFPESKQTVFIPTICLKDGNIFLDDLTVEDARNELGLNLRVVGVKPGDLAASLGFLHSDSPGSLHPKGWYMEEQAAVV